MFYRLGLLLTVTSRKPITFIFSISRYNSHFVPPPRIMNYELNQPTIIESIRGFLLTHLIIRPYFDNEFSLSEFSKGAKHAMCLISSHIAEGNIDELEDLVAPEAIKEIRTNIKKLSVKQREAYKVESIDVISRIFDKIGVIMEGDQRFVEISISFACNRDMRRLHIYNPESPDFNLFKALQGSNIAFDPKKMVTCNYRFIRNYTKGVKDSWLCNRLNHFAFI